MTFLNSAKIRIRNYNTTNTAIPYPHQILDTVRGRLDRGRVGVTVLDPVSTEGMTLDKDLDALANDVRARMLKVFQQDSWGSSSIQG